MLHRRSFVEFALTRAEFQPDSISKHEATAPRCSELHTEEPVDFLPKHTFFASSPTFFQKGLVNSFESCNFAAQLGHGVMVTLQVLVLSFWVRIPVTQHFALIGCVLNASNWRIFLFFILCHY